MVVYRTVTCGELRSEAVGKEVILSGWVHRIRNLGSMVFVDLRDRYGVTQVVFDLRFTPQDVYDLSKQLSSEYVVSIEGEAVFRENPNHKIPTGRVEIFAKKLKILSEAKTLPFPVADETMDVHEETRLKYRYLDLRRGKLLSNLILRHQAMQAARSSLSDDGFIEVSTPILSKSTPEGARDYLVPSRVHQGQFYALPQSPQMFKQILMVGGLDKYFQIATCFRDEDLRADRQPEFQQIDIEMSFASRDELFPIVERLVQRMFRVCKGVELQAPFRRLTHRECMERYGCDKPDVRFGMTLVEATDLAKKTSAPFLAEAIAAQGVVKGINFKKGAFLSRREIEEYTSLVSQFGFKGLAWIKKTPEGLQGPLSKSIDHKEVPSWVERFEIEDGDLIFVLAGGRKKLLQALDQLRRRIAKDHGLIDQSAYEPLWVIDFPLFSWNEEEGKMESEHNPFTSPHLEDIDLIEKRPLDMRSSSYDLVINGYEIASGAQRIHEGALQEKVFQLIGLTEEECRDRFGFFVEALRYGTPPHLGTALGFDRVIMILSGADSIRDVVAFPKNQRAVDPMTEAPSGVTVEQLQELGIRTQTGEKV